MSVLARITPFVDFELFFSLSVKKKIRADLVWICSVFLGNGAHLRSFFFSKTFPGQKLEKFLLQFSMSLLGRQCIHPLEPGLLDFILVQ